MPSNEAGLRQTRLAMSAIDSVASVIELRIPLEPVPQPRHKARAMQTATGKWTAQVYEPKTIKLKDGGSKPHPIVYYKYMVRFVARRVYRAEPLQGPLRVDCCFVMPRPTNKIWKRKPMPRYRHTSTPDRDNLDKAVLDSLKGILWNDDSQVCAGEVEKWVAAGDERPHATIKITPLET